MSTGRSVALVSSTLQHPLQLLGRLRALRFGGPDLGARFALLVFGVAAMTATRSLSFIYSVPDRNIPPIPPMLWVFHQADMLFLPGMNRIHSKSAIQEIQCFTLVLSIALLYLAARSSVPALLRRHYRPLAAAALGVATLMGIVTLQGLLPYPLALGTNHYGNDAVGVNSCAVDAFLKNQNPYQTLNVIGCLEKNQMQWFKTTPLQACAFRQDTIYPSKTELAHEYALALAHNWQHPCEFESYYSYPAASFILPAVGVALHLHDLSIYYLLFYLGVVGIVLWRARGKLTRRMTIIVVAANAALWPTVSSGDTDALYTFLVLLAWTTLRHRWISAIALGLAVAARQQAWLYLLFYAVLVERTEGRRELLWRLAIVSGLFGLTNLPYLIASPQAWLHGILGPMQDPMFPRGSGLVGLSTGGSGSLPLLPHGVYSGLEALALLASLIWYWRTCRAHPGTGLILAPVALFFAWRSLYSYFLPISLLALYPALSVATRPRKHDTDDHTATIDRPEEAAA